MSIGAKIPNKYSMGDHNLDISHCEKDLGIFIDDKLNFEKHITSCVNKANSIMAIARKTFNYMDKSTFKYIFKGLVRPHLEYGAPLWNPHTVKTKELIENVQRRATKLVPGLSNLSYEERLKLLKLPTLAYRRTRGDMIQVYKMLNDGYDSSIPPLLVKNERGLRGNSDKLYVRGGNKNPRKYFFTLRVAKVWNSLPEYVIKAKDINAFEGQLDKHWQDQELVFNFKAEISI